MIGPGGGNEWRTLATHWSGWRLGLGIEFRAASVVSLRLAATCWIYCNRLLSAGVVVKRASGDAREGAEA